MQCRGIERPLGEEGRNEIAVFSSLGHEEKPVATARKTGQFYSRSGVHGERPMGELRRLSFWDELFSCKRKRRRREVPYGGQDSVGCLRPSRHVRGSNSPGFEV